MKDALRTGTLAGIAAAVLVGIVETVVRATDIASSGAATYAMVLVPVFAVASLVPPLAAVGAMVSVLAWALHDRDGAALEAAVRGAWRALGEGSLSLPGRAVGFLAWAGGVVALGTAVQVALGAAFRHAALKGALLTVLVLAGGVMWLAVVRSLLRVLGWVVTWLRKRGSIASTIASSRVLFVAIVVGVLGAVVIVGARLGPTVRDIGEARVAWLVGVPLAISVAWLVAIMSFARWRDRRIGGVSQVAVILGSFAVSAALGELSPVRQAGIAVESPTAIAIRVYSSVTDFDRDGTSGWFGGPDCAPFDSAVGPHATEVPDNGIDDNCVAGDLAVAGAAIENPRAYAELPESFPEKPDIVLITVDALRSDHVSAYGYGRKTTPNIDRHAARAVIFERAYGQGTGTVTSMPSLFTSKYTYQLYYVDTLFPNAISRDETLLAEHLEAAGYRTAAVTTIPYTQDRRWGLLQGFDSVDDSLTDATVVWFTSPKVLEASQRFLSDLRKSDEPFFLWAHFYDVHSEYWEHSDQESFGTERIDLYDGEILYTDRFVGKLLDDVFQNEGERPVLVILTADHGDGFASDRGHNNHGYGLYNELIQVPLVVWAPGAKPRRVTSPVGNVDIAATLMNAARVRDPTLMGWSLLPYVYEGFEDGDRIVFAEKDFKGGPHKAAIGARFKMIRWLHREKTFLFDLEQDPKEKTNVLNLHPEVARRYSEAIDALVERESLDVALRAKNARKARIVPYEPPEAATVTKKLRFGGEGGRRERFDCKDDEILGAFEIVAGGRNRPLSLLRPGCRRGSTGAVRWGAWRGNRMNIHPTGRRKGRGRPKKLGCKPGDRPVGMHGVAGKEVTSIGLVCENVTGAQPSRYTTGAIGQRRGRRFRGECPKGSVMTGYRGRSWRSVIATGFVCEAREVATQKGQENAVAP